LIVRAPAGNVIPLRMESLKRVFFRWFFRLLLAVIALAEWACAGWILFALGWRLPLAAHGLGVAGVFLFNRWVVAARGRFGALGVRLFRVYAATAFTSVFCAPLLAVAGVAWAAARLVGLPVGPGETLALAGFWATNAGLVTVAGVFVFGYTLGQGELTVSELTVPMRGLPTAFDGFRIVQLSDIHIGQYLGLDELAEHVRRVNALDPDLVCLTGDLVDHLERCAIGFPVLAGLRARHGVLATLGNHDFYAGADEVTAALRRLTPFTVLRDARRDVRVDGATLAVVGLDDLGRDWARGVFEHPALPALCDGVPAGVPLVVLSHRPDCFAQAARHGAGLVLSGHTHGGQLALPAWLGRRARNLAQFITEFDRGLYRDGAATLYVNRGLGFSGQRIRLFTPREIACIRLVAA
jgi:predicted MPP superfamily phosphohydrolase